MRFRPQEGGKGEGEGPEGEERGREKRTNAASMHVIYPADRVRDAWDAVARVLGDGQRVVAFRRRFIAPAASGKFALLKPLAK